MQLDRGLFCFYLTDTVLSLIFQALERTVIKVEQKQVEIWEKSLS